MNARVSDVASVAGRPCHARRLREAGREVSWPELSMSPSSSDPFREAVSWLARHAGFPRYRLPARAEAMVFVAALASAEEMAEQQRHALQRRNPAETSALKAHVLRRTQVHYKCDNSAKV